VRRVVPVDEYTTALSRELDLRFGGRGAWSVDTLYFGGGTPSRLGGDGVRRLIDAIRIRIDLTSDAEVTLEANPEDITPDAIRAWRGAGVNRLSIGAQSFNDDVLAWMHRTHDAAAIVRAVNSARAGGIDNLSLDLIFALPQGLTRSWEHDIEQALELGALDLAGKTVEATREALVQKIGENMSVRRFIRVQSASKVAAYVHGVRIGVLVDFAGDDSLGKDLAMHVAALKPVAVSKENVPADLIERPKVGFAIPIDEWLRGPLRDWAEDLLAERRLREEGWLNPLPIRSKWLEHLSRRHNHAYRLWNVLMFEAWLEQNAKSPTVAAFPLPVQTCG
jgi:hypothetical protein